RSTVLHMPSAGATFAKGHNNYGPTNGGVTTVVGVFFDFSGMIQHGFTLDVMTGTFQQFDVPEGSETALTAIANRDRQVWIGGYYVILEQIHGAERVEIF